MITVSIVDANERSTKKGDHPLAGVVAHWLAWECEQTEIDLVPADQADLIFLCHAGQTLWAQNCRKELKRRGVEPYAANRGRRPYIITGGAVDIAPFTALEIADALAVGEAYNYVRILLEMISGWDGVKPATVREVQEYTIDHPHALERRQLGGLARDPLRPWLLMEPPPHLASPDPFVDWDTPLVRSIDKVVRVIASKGCRGRCRFCATTWRQTYRLNDGPPVVRAVAQLHRQGERVGLITNDLAALPYLDELHEHGGGALDSQSLSFHYLRQSGNLARVVALKPKIVRLGVEGISDRIRRAFGKPITEAEIIETVGALHENGINSHLFYIIGAPYEGAEDWEELLDFYKRLSAVVNWGICRIKFTTFQPEPPAPLARFLPAAAYYGHMKAFHYWLQDNLANRHILQIWGRKPESWAEEASGALSMRPAEIRRLQGATQTLDLLPTVEIAARAMWEIIKWPEPFDQRWRLAEDYRRRIDPMENRGAHE